MTPLRPPNIVMVSWKDIHHPKHGGAETYTLTALEGLSQRGCRVTWLVPAVIGRPREETTREGVRIVRRGNRLTHLLHAWRYLRRPEAADLVIDQVNTYPMFTHLFVPREKGLLLIHQLTREVWFYEAPWPVAMVGFLLEGRLLRPYRQWRVVSVSPSTARDLDALGFQRVEVVANALPFVPPVQRARQRPDVPHYVGLGRLVRMKRFEHLLSAFEQVRLELPEARLTIIGRGGTKYAERLAEHVKRVPGVNLMQNASEEAKWEILASATAVVATSVREGWGLMVSEGHAFGTPSIAYQLPGLCDSTRHGVDGLLVKPSVGALARVMIELHLDARRWSALSQNAVRSAADLTPAKQQARLYNVVRAMLDHRL